MWILLAFALLLGLPAFASAHLPTVTVTAVDPGAQEAAKDPGAFAVTRMGGADAPLTVNYSVTGTATAGDDYQALPGSVTIPAGECCTPRPSSCSTTLTSTASCLAGA